jgi:DNA-binding MarR family transcriptional regulator
MRGQFNSGGNDLEKAIAFAIQRAHERVRVTLYREFHEEGLKITPEQWVVLVLLWDREGRTPSELSEAALRDRPTMTRLLDTMERNGLVTRQTARSDKRGRVVRLTQRGRSLRTPLMAHARRIVARLERGISEDDLRVTHRTLQRIVDNLA